MAAYGMPVPYAHHRPYAITDGLSYAGAAIVLWLRGR